MQPEIIKYLALPEPTRNFAEGVALLEAANPQNKVQLAALQKYVGKAYINKQIKLSLYIALKNQLPKYEPQTSKPVQPNNPKTTPNNQQPLSLYAILESDPRPIRDMILDTGRMTDEAFAARNALFYLNTNEQRHEYALKALQLYRKAGENWQKIRVFRESGTMPPELMMTLREIKQEVIDKIDRRRYLVERTYRLQSWIDGRSFPPPQYMEGKTIKPDYLSKWKQEQDDKIIELQEINEWLKND
jgi:hypothetical protein